MAFTKYNSELSEMAAMWNCGEREAAQQLLQSYYILKGNRPALTDFVNTWSDDVLFCSYLAVMDESRKSPLSIDLLALEPVEP